MKIAHIADVHWRGLSRHQEYRQSFTDAFNKLRELSPDVIYIGGDIVHSKTQGISPELIDSLCWWFNGLADIAPVHVILGNHDGLQYNKDRQDAITPIISALDNPRIHLYKDSGVYDTGVDGFKWCVFSCFDEDGWEDVCPDPDSINIALFHGGVRGSTTDVNWNIDGEVNISFFDRFDFTLLGDIHRVQFLDERRTIAYCGSTIQQNYGEDPGKGFLFWEIDNRDDFKTTFHEVYHSQPFITIDWKGTVEETVRESKQHPDGARFRIRSSYTINQAESNHLQAELKKVKNSTEVVFKSSSSFDSSKITSDDGTIKRKNLRDSSVQKTLVRNYYKESEIDEDVFKKLDDLLDKYNSRISDRNETLRNIRWEINKFKFDNLFSYGSNNLINFKNLPGITGIFGKNTKGKSSIIGSLMYGLYNTTDRGSIKNLHIINNRKNNCHASVDLSINGDNFRITRKTIKHQTRKGEVYASTSLNFFKISENGEVEEDLTEEQRRETEKILRKMIGTSDDFLMTSLASQGEMNTFIREKATARKLILSKFLDLQVFEKLYEAAKEDSQDLRNKIKRFPENDWDEELDNIKLDLEKNSKKLSETDSEINESRERLSRLNIELATSPDPDIVTQSEVDAQREEIELIEKDLLSENEKEAAANLKIRSIKMKIDKISKFKEEFPIEKTREKLEFQRELEKTLIELKSIYQRQKTELDRQISSISKLEEVPCGDSFPTCMFIKDSHMDKSRVESQKEIVEEASLLLNNAQDSFDQISNEDLEEKVRKYDEISEKYTQLSVQLSQIQVELNDIVSQKTRANELLKESNLVLQDMLPRVVDSRSCLSSNIRSEIIKIRSEISKLDKKKSRLIEKMASLKIEIDTKEREKAELETIKEEMRVYDIFLQAMSKKGIPLQIMSSQLPVINAEIARILQGVVGFTVELEADQESNSMDAYINYGDSRRVIELASGMEKMMASLAIRVALINVSSLTKTNMLIIDEGFGALDESNIEACSRLLTSLKKWFRNIIIISHVDAIKDCVDSSLDIVKKGKDGKIVHE